LRIELRLAKRRQISGDGLLVVESQEFGIGADESLIEDATGEHIEVFLFDGLQHARADFSDVGDIIERKAATLAFFAKFLSKRPHRGTPPSGLRNDPRPDGNIIRQQARWCHRVSLARQRFLD
jgi:hypothetical protein